MTRRLVLCAALGLAATALGGQENPPPKGAIVLFDGKDTSQWNNAKVTPEGYLEAGASTKERFGDCRLYLEFNIQPDPTGKRTPGNSGVYIQHRYEIQILNSAGQPPSKGGCAAIYQFKAPDTNQSKPPGEWQNYDITFRTPRWNAEKKKTANARITVIHNGVTVHDDVEVPRKTGAGKPEGPEPGPIYLQQHGNKVFYRNIWLLPLADTQQPQ